METKYFLCKSTNVTKIFETLEQLNYKPKLINVQALYNNYETIFKSIWDTYNPHNNQRNELLSLIAASAKHKSIKIPSETLNCIITFEINKSLTTNDFLKLPQSHLLDELTSRIILSENGLQTKVIIRTGYHQYEWETYDSQPSIPKTLQSYNRFIKTINKIVISNKEY